MKNKKNLIKLFLVLLALSALNSACKKENDSEINNAQTETSIASDDPVYSELHEFTSACEKYFNTLSTDRDFLSVYSFLYDDEIKDTVTVDAVKEQTGIEFDEKINAADILYLKPSDISKIAEGISSGEDLRIYTALQTENGVIISSSADKESMVAYEDYKNLLLNYSSSHGEIRNPKIDTEDFKGILAAVNEHYGKEINYDIKHIACDDLYACIVVSELENISQIKEFALRKSDNKWSIIADGLENAASSRKQINNLYPDFELGLLPIYNIADFGKIESNFDDFIFNFTTQNIINESDLPVTYACGAQGFAYFEFESSLKIISFVNEKNELECYPVKDAKEAMLYMVKASKNPPVFILKMGDLMISENNS